MRYTKETLIRADSGFIHRRPVNGSMNKGDGKQTVSPLFLAFFFMSYHLTKAVFGATLFIRN